MIAPSTYINALVMTAVASTNRRYVLRGKIESSRLQHPPTIPHGFTIHHDAHLRLPLGPSCASFKVPPTIFPNAIIFIRNHALLGFYTLYIPFGLGVGHQRIALHPSYTYSS